MYKIIKQQLIETNIVIIFSLQRYYQGVEQCMGNSLELMYNSSDGVRLLEPDAEFQEEISLGPIGSIYDIRFA